MTRSHDNTFQFGDVSIELNLVTLLVAWACSEIIRYSFFALKVQSKLFFTKWL